MMCNYLSFVDCSIVYADYLLTQYVPMPIYTVVKEQIFSASHYARIWIPSLNKDKGVDVHKQFSGTKNVWNGVILSGCHYNQDNTQCLCFF